MILLILSVVGLCMGSFANAAAWRMYKRSKVNTKQQKAKYSIAHGRSMCTYCGHPLAAVDLVPIFSWLYLRGKCRYCRKRIFDNPLPEIVTPLLFVGSYLLWPRQWNSEQVVLFCFWLAYLIGFVILGIYDFRWRLLPNKIIAILAGIVFIQTVVRIGLFGMELKEVGILILSALVGGGIFWILFQISGGKWIGGGDVKLGFVLGAILGSPLQALLYIFIASLLGTVIAIPGIASQKLKFTSKLPFGPYLMFAAVITGLYGQTVIDWYIRMTGL